MLSSRSRGTAAILLMTLGLAGFGRCGPEWELTWREEFDGPAGQAPNAAVWTHDVGTGWGNQQLEFDTDRTENAALDGQGNLAIVARRESWQGSNYTSARIVTKGKVERKYGRIEARIQLPAGQGLWPAFWLLGANIDQVGWPTCGEIDVMEFRGQAPGVAIGSLHGPGYSAGNSISSTLTLPEGQGFDQGFHVFGIEWDEGLITWNVDGRVYHSVGRADLPAGAAWVFDQPFYVILNLAVGGNFVGPPNAATQFPATMLVDWVRVYERG